MKEAKAPAEAPPLQWRIRRSLLLIIPALLSFIGALLAGIWLNAPPAFGAVSSLVIALGLDEVRARLLASLLMAAGAGLVGGLVGRRRWSASLGAGIVFWFSYLSNFIQTELLPARDPGGNLEPLNSGALAHTACTMAALALLCAFIGSAVGIAVGQALLDPCYNLYRFVRERFMRGRYSRQQTQPMAQFTAPAAHSPSATPGWLRLLFSWSGVVVLLTLLLLAAGSGNLFLFSPDIGIHTPPTIHTTLGEPAYGTIVQDSYVSPALHGQRRSFFVYLPPSYSMPAAQQRRYPTLYLLHGSPGGPADWIIAGKADQSANTLIALKKIPELIMVFPDGNGRPGATSEWADSGDHKQLIETSVAVDLVRYIDQKYRTIADPAHRAIGGLSMGGFGATNIGIHHPALFGQVISLGGYYHAEGSIWGKSPAYIQANSPADTMLTARAARKIRFFLGAATNDRPYYTYTLQFARELKTLHVRYQLDVQKGSHAWNVWQVQLYNALLWLHWG